MSGLKTKGCEGTIQASSISKLVEIGQVVSEEKTSEFFPTVPVYQTVLILIRPVSD